MTPTQGKSLYERGLCGRSPSSSLAPLLVSHSEEGSPETEASQAFYRSPSSPTAFQRGTPAAQRRTQTLQGGGGGESIGEITGYHH